LNFRRLRPLGNISHALTPPNHELRLKLIIAALFLPEGFSFYIGDFRLTVVRVLIISFTCITLLSKKPERGFVASDFFAVATAVCMLTASTITEGFAGLKGATIAAFEFSGSYFIFRYSLDSVNSSVRTLVFACKVLVVVTLLALLDPLTGRLFTYEFAKGLTGYAKTALDLAFASHADAIFRDGVVRAMGPMEHSILFGCVCAWFGTIAFFVYPNRPFGWTIAILAAIGLWFSEARGAWLAYIIAFGICGYYQLTTGFRLRWKILGLVVAIVVISVFSISGAPIATLMRLGGLSPEAAYYRQAIWAAASPFVLHSPLVGIGSTWDWESSSDLFGSSVDAFWLQNSMTYGIPATIFALLTMVSPFWHKPLDTSPLLTREERRLSVALGIVTVTAIFLGFIVHFWGACWILLGIFPAVRASLFQATRSVARASLAASLSDESDRTNTPVLHQV
jgi:hypothetical protein